MKKTDVDILIAQSTVKEKESGVRSADATTEYRKQGLERWRGMARDGTVTANFVAERQKFYEAAAADSGRRIALREIKGQPLDHPEVLTIPETGYLKGALVEALD